MNIETAPEIRQHFVPFYSPGTFIAETAIREIDSWDTGIACATASTIVERHGATPYGFRFSTRGRSAEDLDSKEIDHSGFYFLGGEVKTLAMLIAENNPDDHILIDNMRSNGWNVVVVNTNSWKWTQLLEENDTVLTWASPSKKQASV